MENINTITSTTDTTGIKAKITNWDKIATGGVVTYALDGAGSANWVIKADFSTAADKEAIATALKTIQGYNGSDNGSIDSYKFNVNLLTGAISAASA